MDKLKLLFVFLCLNVFIFKTVAQETKSVNKSIFGQTKLVIVGNAQADYTYNKDENAFGNVAFKPIFLWSLSDKLFIESEIEIATGDGAVEVVLEYANMVYFLNNNLAIHFGRFLPKFGSYRGKYMEGYFNRFPNNPVGFGDGGIGPMVETGIGLQGGAEIGKATINYDFYISNGPQLLPGNLDAPDEAGQFEYEAYKENNKDKAIGGRIGILPLYDSSLELGLSFQHAAKTGDSGTSLENVKVDMYAVDLSYFKSIEAISSNLKILGEWKSLNAGDAYFQDFESGSGNYTFKNKSTAYYVQASIRPSGATSDFVNNLEFAGRYSEFDTPKEALWGGGLKKQTAFSLNYWLGWNRVFKVSYQMQDNQPNSLIAQLVYGF